MTASIPYLDAVAARRSHYALSAESTISDDELLSLVQHAVKHTPTSFNSQSGRAVLVLGNKHRQLWDTVYDAYKVTISGDAEKEAKAKQSFESTFRAAYGTVVFFEDQDAVKAVIAKSPNLALNLPIWSQNSAGILQHVVWTALQAEGLGANLQHYGQVSPEIEAAIHSVLDVPPNWISSGLLPFGKPTGPPGRWGPKTFQPINDRVKVVS